MTSRLPPVGVLCLLLAMVGVTPCADAARPAIDFFQGPLVNATRPVGLGGAYVAVAEGAAGHLTNPASFAVRELAFADDWFDWDFNVNAFTILGSGVDYDMSGATADLSAARAQQYALSMKLGRFGIGVAIRAQHFTASTTDSQGRDAVLEYDHDYGGLGMAYAFADGELVLGMVLGGSNAHIKAPPKETGQEAGGSVSMADGSLLSSFGVLFAPAGQRYRLGCTLRMPGEMTQARAAQLDDVPHEETKSLAGWQTPRAVLVGGAFALGFSYMFGPHPTNITPGYGEAKRPVRSRARRYVLVSTDLEITGGVDGDAVGVQGYLAGTPGPAGQSTVVSVRVGVESELLANRLRLRGGSYFEPSRFEGSAGRLHAVAGGDVRVTLIWDWSISAVADVATGYNNWSLSLGFWH